MVEKIDQNTFTDLCNHIHSNFYNYDKVVYVNKKIKVIITCPIHGDFGQTPADHLRGRGCKKCKLDKQKITFEQFEERAKSLHNNKYTYVKDSYITLKEKVKIICPIHGEFLQSPNSHLRGSECSKCRLKAQTKLFNKLKSKFENEELMWEATPVWLDKQRFDIYFPKYNIAVEYNGEQHYEAKECFGGDEGYKKCLERDALKRQKCLDNDCNLFELKYNYKKKDFDQLTIDILTIIKSLKNEN